MTSWAVETHLASADQTRRPGESRQSPPPPSPEWRRLGSAGAAILECYRRSLDSFFSDNGRKSGTRLVPQDLAEEGLRLMWCARRGGGGYRKEAKGTP